MGKPTFSVGSEVTITDRLWGHGWEPGTRVRVIQADKCRDVSGDDKTDGYCYSGVDAQDESIDGFGQIIWAFTSDEAKIA